MINERVICSAIKYQNKIYYGHRHTHCYIAMKDELSWHMNRQEQMETVRETVEGFITTLGRFVDREEAYRIQTGLGFESEAIEEGQDYRHRLGELFSEDLY